MSYQRSGGLPGSGTYPAVGTSAPDHSVMPAWVDTSTVPPVFKTWNGAAWTASFDPAGAAAGLVLVLGG